jgi:hypothetical protein
MNKNRRMDIRNVIWNAEVSVITRSTFSSLNNFLEVILQKPCNTHRHEYLEKLLINNWVVNIVHYKCGYLSFNKYGLGECCLTSLSVSVIS